jgi:hypothetical protein
VSAGGGSGDGAKAPFQGGCHCGAVRFEVRLTPGMESHACNCSMCAKLGFLHLIAPEADFRLLSGEDKLTRYTFNTGVAEHLFCSACGVKSFYRPRSNPEGWSINLRCLDKPEALHAVIVPFDGQNWEASAPALAQLA